MPLSPYVQIKKGLGVPKMGFNNASRKSFVAPKLDDFYKEMLNLGAEKALIDGRFEALRGTRI